MFCVFLGCNKQNNSNPSQEPVKPPLSLADGAYTIYFDSIVDESGNTYAEDKELIKKKANKIYSCIYWRSSVYTCDTPICDSIFFSNNMIEFYNFRTIIWNFSRGSVSGCSCDSLNEFKITSLYWDNDNKLNGHFQSYDYDANNNMVKVNGLFRFWPE
jgi:hypothetical protein